MTASNNYSFLQPFTLPRGQELKNRVFLAPMTNFASKPDGEVSDEEIAYYERRSGGASVVVTACANVTENGKGFKDEIGVHHDDFIPGLTRLADAIKAKGSKAILQIFHGGRMCPPELVPDNMPVSASAVAPVRDNAVTPRALEKDEINHIIHSFGEAARRAAEAGFDGVEIHGANTYLIQQFFSPHSNRREDEWGGSFENRTRFPLAVTEAVLEAAKTHADDSFIVGYRLSPEEAENPGITMEDTLALSEILASQPLDYIHVSVQNFWSGSMRDEHDTASRVTLIQDRIGSRIPVIGVGSLHTPEEVEKALASGVPLIALGREFIMEPDWVEKAADGKTDTIQTTLSVHDQRKLVIPDALWQAIIHTPGWFPVTDK